MEKDEHIVRPMENTLILSLPATQTEPYLAMCPKNFMCCHIAVYLDLCVLGDDGDINEDKKNLQKIPFLIRTHVNSQRILHLILF